MNKDQRAYALGRVSAILSEKLTALKEKHSVEKKVLTPLERAELVRKGKVKLKAETIGDYDRHSDLWDWTPFEQREPLAKAYGPAAGKLEAEAQKVRDQIMLGDTAEAMALLAAFDKF